MFLGKEETKIFIPDPSTAHPLTSTPTPSWLASFQDNNTLISVVEKKTKKRSRDSEMLSSPKRPMLEGNLSPIDNNLPSPTMSPTVAEAGTTLTLTSAHQLALNYSIESIPNMISTYDSFPDSLKSYFLLQLLKRSPINTLQLVSSIVTPCLKQDFVQLLPLELCHNIFSFLDVRSLGKCHQVNKKWRNALVGQAADLAIWKVRIINERFSTEDDLRRKVLKSDDTRTADNKNTFYSYLDLYKRSHLIRRNWLNGRYSHISFPGHANNVVTCLQFDTEKIVSGSDDHTIHIYGTSSGELEKRLVGHDGGVWALQYYENTLVSGSTDRTVRVWDMNSGECTHIFDGHTSTVRCLLILEQPPIDGKKSTPLIITGSRDTTLRVWSLPGLHTRWNPSIAVPTLPSMDSITAERTRNPFFKFLFTGHTSSVRAIAGHGHTLISGSYDCTVRCWNLLTGENTFTFRGHREKVYSVGYSHELERAVSGSMDYTVKVWCTRTGVQLFHLEGHTSLVGLLELSHDFLISAAADATLRIWCPKTGRCLATLAGHSAAITCFHHDPVYNRIVSGSDGGVKIWELDSQGYGTNGLVNSSVIPLDSPLANKLSVAQTPLGTTPLYGRYINDVLTQVQGVWRVKMDESKLVCACQREPGGTWFEVLDFSESPLIGTHTNKQGDQSNIPFDNPDEQNEDEEEVDEDDEVHE